MVYRIHICRICSSKVVVGNGDRNSKTNLVFSMVDFALDGHRYKNQVKVFMDQISALKLSTCDFVQTVDSMDGWPCMYDCHFTVLTILYWMGTHS